MPDETEIRCDHLNISFTNKNNKLTLLRKYKIFYNTREIRFHYRFPEPKQLCDYEKVQNPNMIFWRYLEDLQIVNAHIYVEPTKHIIYVHHDRHFFKELVDDCVAANADKPEYHFDRAEFERLIMSTYPDDEFYLSPAPSPRNTSSPSIN